MKFVKREKQMGFLNRQNNNNDGYGGIRSNLLYWTEAPQVCTHMHCNC